MDFDLISQQAEHVSASFKKLFDPQRISQILMRRYIDIGPGHDKTAYMNSEVQYLGKAGQQFSYLEANTVIDTLNEAFTPLGWGSDSSQLVFQPVAVDGVSKQIAVHVILEVYTPWGTVRKSGWGARTVMATGEGSKHDFGDDVKSAASDGLKKAATQLGVFNYIYRFGTERPRAMPVSEDVAPILVEIKALADTHGWNKDALLRFCSGVVHKTLIGAGDLNVIQAHACLDMLRALSSAQPASIAPAA